tara:strand:+ start:221 stop:634 length:414 start_codon:yes stop_codon:yes gene_type:complete
MRQVRDEAFALFKRKNRDYGDSYKKFSTVGVLVRSFDKIERLLSITNSGINYVKDESMRDTLLDIANYALMGIICMDDQKRYAIKRLTDVIICPDEGEDEVPQSGGDLQLGPYSGVSKSPGPPKQTLVRAVTKVYKK